MERIRNNNTLRKTGAFVGLLGVIGLAGCAEYNYKGNGNKFTVAAVVDHNGDYSVSIEEKGQKVIEAEGEAYGWFGDNNPHQIHNHYKDDSDGCETKKFVGSIVDEAGNKETLQDLQPGDHIVISGFISQSSKFSGKSCGATHRPVFTRIVDHDASTGHLLNVPVI